MPERVVYGSNPNGFRFRTLNQDFLENPKLRSLKYLNYGFAELDLRKNKNDFSQFSLKNDSEIDAESRV